MGGEIPTDIVEFAEWLTGYKMKPVQVDWLRWHEKNVSGKSITVANRGGSKTFLAAILATYRLVHFKNYSIIIGGGSREQASRCFQYIHQFFEDKLGAYIEYKATKTRIKIPENRNYVVVCAASLKSIRSRHCNLFIYDEVEYVDDDRIHYAVLGVPTLSPSQIILLSTFDWEKPMSWFKQRWKNAKKEGWKTFRWTIEDVMDIGDLKKRYEDAKMMQNQAYLDAEWHSKLTADPSRVVFKDLDKAIVGETYTPIEGYPIRIGVDWGFRHPTAMVVTQLRPNGIVVVLETMAWERTKSSDIRPILAKKYEFYSQYASDIAINMDVSSTPEHVEQMREEYPWIKVVGVGFQAEKTNMLLNAVAWFEKNMIKISQKFGVLIDQLAAYTWVETKSGKLKTSKTYDDYVDALLLALKDWRPVPQAEKMESMVIVDEEESWNEVRKFLGNPLEIH